ncbi:hypothetical protein KO516_22650 [Citreicella sp. C3M06]|uniref:DnaA N-terminal domain-containing protein n=1 Tax=Citreicella sp. C3M06 TaxID=2841564 RepID=UPI001C0A30B4|nr:DnaA N-terminal domain-containing protein [Citreicella sp. C3M06]MBU2963576.1 hypothetical protein [Citreicella sp. C3M06]
MKTNRFTGPQAGPQKYDLLTAMSVAGLNGSATFQTSMLRLVAVVTARYNWRLDELTVGQRELARMWSVDERTVKREIKRLTSAGILLQLRPGVRGRVAAYRLNLAEIHRLSAPVWENVGPDFTARMGAESQAPDLPNVVHLNFGAPRTAEPAGDPRWNKVQDRLARTDPGLHASWFAALRFAHCDGSCLHLTAPSSFAAQYLRTHHMRPLQGAVALEFSGVHRIEIDAPQSQR